MSNQFENIREEAKELISKAKKEQLTFYYEVRKYYQIAVTAVNGIVVDQKPNIENEVYMRVASHNGYTIDGSSTRTYLPDVMSRLYQTLRNLLGAHKGHVDIESLQQGTKKLTELRLSHEGNEVCTLEKLKDILELLQQDLPTELTNQFNVNFHLSMNYARGYAGGTDLEEKEYDDLQTNLEICISLKSNEASFITLNYFVPRPDIDVQDWMNKLVNKITIYAHILLKECEVIDPQSLMDQPHQIVLERAEDIFNNYQHFKSKIDSESFSMFSGSTDVQHHLMVNDISQREYATDTLLKGIHIVGIKGLRMGGTGGNEYVNIIPEYCYYYDNDKIVVVRVDEVQINSNKEIKFLENGRKLVHISSCTETSTEK
ncbi:MAG: hypothetical protein ACOCXT_03005 [Candidatus Dojkabacteria bacterium]